MPQRTAIWTVSDSPSLLAEARLPSEKMLEDMIVAAPRVISDEWMLIGRQETTVSGRLTNKTFIRSASDIGGDGQLSLPLGLTEHPVGG
jgi:hypothetical protein